MTLNKQIFLPLLVVLFAGLQTVSTAHAYSIVVAEKARGEYQNGLFKEMPDRYQYSFDINERERKVRLIETRRLGDGAVDSRVTEYDILSIENKIRNGTRQKVIIFAKDKVGLSRETYILGETFFEYCNSSSDRFFLSSGDVSLSVALRARSA